MKSQPSHPIQPLVKDAQGVIRFKENKIVSRLLAEGGIDLNKIALWDVSVEDREQFAMLIGYSHSGFGDLSYVRDETFEAAELLKQNLKRGKKKISEQEARIQYLSELVKNLRTALRAPMSMLFGIHPDDLKGRGQE